MMAVATTERLRFLWLEITGRCQLRCRHCYSESGPDKGHGSMRTGDWRRVLDEAADLGVSDVQFIGGEPTLHPNLPELVLHALGRGLAVEVYSNLVRVTDPSGPSSSDPASVWPRRTTPRMPRSMMRSQTAAATTARWRTPARRCGVVSRCGLAWWTSTTARTSPGRSPSWRAWVSPASVWTGCARWVVGFATMLRVSNSSVGGALTARWRSRPAVT